MKAMIMAVLCAGLTLFAASARAALAASESHEPPGAVTGIIQDAESGERLGWVGVVLVELEYGISSHADGEFHLYGVAPGRYTLRAMRIGYRQMETAVTVRSGDTLRLVMKLSPSPLTLGSVETIAESDDPVEQKPEVRMMGGELQRELGTTIAETVEEQPGVAQRTMGPAPARPVLRGLGGDRFRMLEDGAQTGDLSASSADHAVAIEPMTAEQIEVLRGPQTALYGPLTLGGAVNVERGLIVTGLPHRAHGAATGEYESVNRGGAGGASFTAPLRSFALHADGSLRSTQDIRTPKGELHNTTIRTSNGGAGISYLQPWGLIGAAGSTYDTEYGIPGGFVGAHPNGVTIKLNRRNAEARLTRYWNGSLIHRADVEYSYSRYYHAEYESSGRLGMEFGVLTDHLSAHVHFGEHGIFGEGAFGFTGELRDYATGGLTNTPATDERQIGVFLYETAQFSRVKLSGAMRFDRREIKPDREYENYFAGYIRRRDFDGFSGSLAAEYRPDSSITLGAMATRSWRAPTVEELYSEGPHLAAYAYEIGNPDLKSERGLGWELSGEIEQPRFNIRAAVFLNSFEGYVYPRNTGHLSARRADLYEYRYEGVDARMTGGELRGSFNLSRHWLLRASGSVVRGEITPGCESLSMMPPLTGGIAVEYHLNAWTWNAETRGAAAQTRTGEFEQPTAAWLRCDASVQYQFAARELLHTITLAAENVTDTEYRNHLSRVKVIMPEPARNIKMLYKIRF